MDPISIGFSSLICFVCELGEKLLQAGDNFIPDSKTKIIN